MPKRPRIGRKAATPSRGDGRAAMRGLPVSAMTPLNRWCAQRRRAILIGLVIAAALLRIGYFVELNAGPLVWQHKWDQSDMNYFDRWAKTIDGGDVLSRHLDPPLTGWMIVLADRYYQKFPGETPASVPGEAAEQAHLRADMALWKKWVGPGRFFQEPLYPYLIALIYKIFGPDVRFAFIWQFLVGIGLIVCVHAVTRRVFGDFAALIAGVMAVAYAPLLMMEMLLLRDSLVALVSVLMAALGTWAMRRRKDAGRWLVFGIVCGIAQLLKSHFVIVTGLTLVWLIVEGLRRKVDWVRPAAALVAGFLIAMIPLVARNVTVGISPFATVGNGAATVILANSVDAGVASLGGLNYFVDIQTRAQGRFFETLRESIATHQSFGSWVTMLADKFAASWHWYEWPGNENFYYYRMHSQVLRAMPLTFYVLGPLGLVGVLMGLLRWRRAAALYWPLVANLALLVLFFVAGRYRLAFAAGLLPFAGMVVAYAIGTAIHKNYQTAGLLAVLTAIAMMWTSRALPEGMEEIRPTDFKVPYEYYYGPRITDAANAKDFAQASRIYAELLADQPSFVKDLHAGTYVRSPDQTGTVDYFSQAYGMYARALTLTGDAPGAAAANARAAELRACEKP